MYTTHSKAELAQLKCQLRALEKGYLVSKPTTEARYDLVIDEGTKLCRVQIKYCDRNLTQASNVILVDLQTECRNNGYLKCYAADEIDYVLVYSPKTDMVYRLGPEHFAEKKSVSLRIELAKNGQTKDIKMAKDFVW